MRDNNLQEARRWVEQAEFDLKAAGDSMDSGNFEWSCFQAQQAAEKFLKGYLYSKGNRILTTHSVDKLLSICVKEEGQFSNITVARELDQYYIPTRYPNGLPAGVPHKFYTKENADICLKHATSISSLIKRLLPK